jgi:hypothetical protein
MSAGLKQATHSEIGKRHSVFLRLDLGEGRVEAGSRPPETTP